MREGGDRRKERVSETCERERFYRERDIRVCRS
jgi:hypothetical protein